MNYRIFAPHSLFSLKEPCFLVGQIHSDVTKPDSPRGHHTGSERKFSREIRRTVSVVISAAVVVKCDTESKTASKLLTETLKNAENVQIVGFYDKETKETSQTIKNYLEMVTSGLGQDHFLRINLTKDNDIMIKELIGFGQKVTAYQFQVFLFDPFDFSRCPPSNGQCPADDVTTHLSLAAAPLPTLPPSSTVCFYEQNDRGDTCAAACLVAVDFLCGFVSFLTAVILTVHVKSGFRRIASEVSPYVNLTNQSVTRLKQFDFLRDISTKKSIQHWNCLLAIVFDVTLGIIVTSILCRFFTADTLLDLSLERTEVVANKLKDLLKWMMGSPAGFKLNYPLNYSLGTFFLFHIYLWQEYLSVLQTALKCILQVLLWTGFFGFTFQLSLLQDLLALSTFHIYCFYAYAAKIYHLNFAGLASFWRLFRGKKWNPLRQRIDSCSFRADQLFLGTLSLTVLLFLIPTTFIYYVVFTILRLGVLLVQGSIQKIITAINDAPLYTFVLFATKSNLLTDGIEVAVVSRQHPNTSPLVFTIKGAVCTWKKACSMYQYPVTTAKERLSWSQFIRNLLVGDVIYPI